MKMNGCSLNNWYLRKTMLDIQKIKPPYNHEEIVRAQIASNGLEASQKREDARCA